MSNQHYVNLANDVVGMINEQNEAYVPSRVSYNSSSSQASAPPVSSNASRQPNLPPARQANTSLEIIEGHDEIFDPPPNSDYECPICMMVLRNPVQTICGHRFCNGCMNQHIRLNGPKCPSDNQQLNTNEIYADNFAKREINQLNVKCRTLKNNKECPWHGPLKNLEDHLKTCEYVETPCPKGCNQSIERRALDQHLRKDCPKRTVTCQYCKTEILQKNMKDHLGKCQKVTVTCPNCNKKMLREKLNSGHEKECPKANISCEYRNIGCKWSGQRHQVQHHLNSDMKEHLSMMNVALASLLSANGRERNRPASRAEASTSSGASSSNAADTFDRNLEEFNRLVKRNNDQINALMLRTEQIERSFRDLTARVDRQHRENEAGLTSVKNTIVDLEARMCNGVYLWRITNYPRHRENARENVVTALHSPPFYTSFYGYKLCLRINPNGVDTGYGSHVSLFVHMMQTEWDDTLEWPFSGRISLSILDQSDDGDYKRHISETLVTRPNLLAFQRPTTPRNHKGYGYVEFAHAETLQDRQYLKNDCLLIRVQVFQ